MFREMRRKRQQLTPDECSAILRGASSGVLAVLGDIGCSTGPALMGAVSGAISSSAAVCAPLSAADRRFCLVAESTVTGAPSPSRISVNARPMRP